ncbi:MAG: hypothetical protein AAFQ80_11245 [Cyanobacteria bacterium J06621_8]
MSSSQDNPEKKKKDSTLNSEDDQALSSELNKKNIKTPKFKKEDMYRIKYDF